MQLDRRSQFSPWATRVLSIPTRLKCGESGRNTTDHFQVNNISDSDHIEFNIDEYKVAITPRIATVDVVFHAVASAPVG